MAFLEQANSGINKPSSYYLTLVLVLLAYLVLGQLPLLIDLYMHAGGEVLLQGGTYAAMRDALGANRFFVHLLLPFVFSFFMLLLAIRVVHKRPVLSVFTSRSRFDWKRYFFSILVFGSIVSLTFLFTGLGNNKLHWNFKGSSFFGLFLLSSLLIPFQTACEDVLFRGYLLQGVAKATKKPWLAVLLSALLFGLLHGANPEVQVLGPIVLIYYILTGLFLTLLTLWDDGLELSMGYHMINNWFAAVIVTNNWQAFQTDALYLDTTPPNFGWENLITLVVIQPLLLALFYRKYRWYGLVEKLKRL